MSGPTTGLEPPGGAEQAPGVDRVAQEMVRLLERLVLGEGDDDGGLVTGADDDDLLAVVDDGIEDLGVVGARLGRSWSSWPRPPARTFYY